MRCTGAAALRSVLAVVVAILTAAPALGAQQLTRWSVSSTAGVCGVMTTNQQQNIPSAGFGVSADTRDAITLLIKGYMTSDGSPIKEAVVQFGPHRERAQQINFSPLDDNGLYGLALRLPVSSLTRLAETPAFSIELDGEPFATYMLAERGDMVVQMARCMRAFLR